MVRNVAYSFLGQGVPLLAALVAIPLLISGLGTHRFGVLTVVWIVVGYASLFDLGLGKALTQLVSERLGAGKDSEVGEVVWTALLMMAGLGLVGVVVLLVGIPWIVRGVLTVPATLQQETVVAFSILALSLPIIITTAGLRGVLEAKHLFGRVNAIRLPLGVFMFVGPLFVLPFSTSLVPVVAVTVGARVLAWIAHLAFCVRAVPALGQRPVIRRATALRLLRFGGWMTVSNVVSPLMVYADRFMIGALLSVSAVAYYVTPYEVVTKLWIVSGALTAVLFPVFASTFASDPRNTVALFHRGLKTILIALFPVILVLIIFAPEGLNAWLGSEFAENSTRVLQWLAIGVFVNSVATIPFNALQGAARADLVAKLHLAELPLYLLAVWWLIGSYGIEGAAIAWMARIVVDTAALFFLVERIVPGSVRDSRRTLGATGLALLVIVAIAASAGALSGATKGALLLSAFMVFMLVVWYVVLDRYDRHSLQQFVGLRGEPV